MDAFQDLRGRGQFHSRMLGCDFDKYSRKLMIPSEK